MFHTFTVTQTFVPEIEQHCKGGDKFNRMVDRYFCCFLTDKIGHNEFYEIAIQSHTHNVI